MKKLTAKYFSKLFVKRWIIGISRSSIREVVKNKTFNPDINWLPVKTFNRFLADPFLFRTEEGGYNIFLETFSFDDNYGKIALMTIDENLNEVNYSIILDTKSHLSYPFVFRENNETYIFPEAAQSGKLACYKYDPVNKSLIFLQEILDLPLKDPTILKYENKYWLFGILSGENSFNKLYIYFSDNLLGPYTSHAQNPVKDTLNGSRPAGSFFEVDGTLYRPSQNCEKGYGESISINKVIELNDVNFAEEPYMSISTNKMSSKKLGIHKIHTINAVDDLIVVDGERWIFSPVNKLKYFIKRKSFLRFRKSGVFKNGQMQLKFLMILINEYNINQTIM